MISGVRDGTGTAESEESGTARSRALNDGLSSLATMLLHVGIEVADVWDLTADPVEIRASLAKVIDDLDAAIQQLHGLANESMPAPRRLLSCPDPDS
jgi:hypothetical protein